MANDRVVQASLGLGGNIGDVAGSFIHALRSLGDAPGVSLRRASSIYLTPPWGKLDQPSFLNMAAILDTGLAARALLALCLEIEQSMGRRRLERWGPRTLDIDILTYGDSTIDDPGLKVPHPRITERVFVLAPLAEIAPHLRIADREVAQWLADLDCAGVEIEPAATASVRAALRLDGEAG